MKRQQRVDKVSNHGEPAFDRQGNVGGYAGVAPDSAEGKLRESLLNGEKQVLEMIAQDAPLEQTLTALMQVLESQSPGMLCSVLLLDTDGLHLGHGAAPSLPEEYVRAIDGVAIGESVGSCGTAAYRRAQVFVEDIATDPLWSDYRDLALRHGLRACWSTPICDSRSRVLGTFAVYYRQPFQATASHRWLIANATHMAAIAILRQEADAALRKAKLRLEIALEGSQVTVWETDLRTNEVWLSKSWAGYLGKSAEDTRTTVADLFALVHPDDRYAVAGAADAVIKGKLPSYSVEHRVKLEDGGWKWILSRGRVIARDAGGQPLRMSGTNTDITERKRAEDKLRFQAQLLETVGDAVIACDTDANITYMNSAAEQLYGWPAEEAWGRNVFDTVRTVASREAGFAAMRSVERGHAWRGEVEGRRRDGTTFPVHLTLATVHDAQGVVIGLVGVSNDISELKRVEQAIRDKARQQGLIAAFSQGILACTQLDDLCDMAVSAIRDGLDVEHCNILQFTPEPPALVLKAGSGMDEEWMDSDIVDLAPGTQNRLALDGSEALIIADVAQEIRFAVPKIMARHGMRSGASIRIGGAEGVHGLLCAYSRDASRFARESIDYLQSIANTLASAIDRNVMAERFAYRAQFDALTSLPNRSLFCDRLALTLTQSLRSKSFVAVAVLNVDRFRDVNASLGHGGGDQLLVLLTQRLQACIRTGDTLGRLEGDKFGIVLSNLATVNAANLVVSDIAREIAIPYTVNGDDVHITGSFGISFYPDDGDAANTLLENAETAAKRARKRGRNRVHFHTAEFNTRASHRLALERDLREAIARKEFRLHYQPEIALNSRRIVGVEALIRWQHPARGLLAPAEFIALAEETELIVPIGQWAIDEACAQLAQWHGRGHTDLFVAVNVSPLQIRQGGVVEYIRSALAQTGLEARFLEVELTETLVMDGAESFIRVLRELKAIGITLAVDDFGTGYSSLSYLRRFPVDKVKIDKTFIHDIGTDPDAVGVVRAIIAMAHHLRLKVTVEGIETEEQAGLLRGSQCDIGQGYLFGHPVEPEAMGALLDARSVTPLLDFPPGSARSRRVVDDDNALCAVQGPTTRARPSIS